MAALPATARAEMPTFTYAEERDAVFVDELVQVAEDKRTETLGPNYFEWVREFFMFRPAFWQPQLEYQIKLRSPDLQMLLMQEASDLTDTEPMFFISRQGERRQERELAFMMNWRAENYQLEWNHAMVWSQLCHTAFMEVYFDNQTRGVKLRARNPQNIYPDPFCPDWRDWEYVVVRVPMAPDEIVRRFPGSADRLPGLLAEHQREMFLESRLGGVIGSGPMSIEMPPGAMQSVAIGRPPGATDFLSVDYLYIKDESRESVQKEIEGSKAAGALLPPPRTIPKYPHGRLIIRTGKLKLWDGPAQYRRFPIVPLFSLPPIYGTWGTPPVQYLIQMQHLSESMYSQAAENAIRLNYGYRLFADGMILNPEAMDKLGASLRVKTADDVSKAFKVIPPTPFSSQQAAFPTELLQHMRQLYGYTPERQGQIGAGNISPGLLDAGINTSMGMSRMRARYLSESVEHVGRLVYETMVDWLGDTEFAESLSGDFRTAPWQQVPLDQIDSWKVELDANSMKPMSSSALRMLVPTLANLGWLTPDVGLKWLGVPQADDVAKKLEENRQQELMAVASGEMKLKNKKGGKGKK